jgi:hypothetical protein
MMLYRELLIGTKAAFAFDDDRQQAAPAIVIGVAMRRISEREG